MIPVAEPLLAGREAEYVAECLATGWISSAGRFLDAFEQSWAAYCGRRHGIAVSNGTVALELAVAALGIGPGDEVIIPAFTIISCALAVTRAGATPVLVDASPATWGIDVAAVEARITPRTKAIMPVHLYGHPVDMAPLLALAASHGIAIVEDAAEAHGADYRMPDGTWRRAGSFGEVSCFSFYANKIVTTGEGGMVLTDDDALAARLRSLRNLAFTPERRFLHRERGFNFRMTNVQAAMGLAQVERIDETIARKRAVAAAYRTRLGGLRTAALQPERQWARSAHWMVGLLLADDARHDAASLAAALQAAGVETRPFFLGMHRQPALTALTGLAGLPGRGLFAGEAYPVTDRLAERGLYLPSGNAITDAQVDAVCDAVLRELD